MDKPRSNKLVYAITIILLILLVGGIKSAAKLKSSISKLAQAKTDLVDIKAQNEDIKKQIAFAGSEAFIEKAALEKLNLTKEGYKIVIMDTDKSAKVNYSAEAEEHKVPDKPNWMLWRAEFNF